MNALPPTFTERFPKTPTFDLVYLISVFTHLSESVFTQLLKDIEKSMECGGVLVFTTHGPISASKIEIYGAVWVDRGEKVRIALDEIGSYFEEYSYGSDKLGMSWHTEHRVYDIVADACPSLRARKYDPARLDNHQDVFVFQKTSQNSAWC